MLQIERSKSKKSKSYAQGGEKVTEINRTKLISKVKENNK